MRRWILIPALIAGMLGMSGQSVLAAGDPSTNKLSASKDYILGRPMTEEEIQAQKEEEPENLVREQTLFLPEAEPIEDMEMLAPVLGAVSTLPESYDAREDGLVTSVKDQNPWGSCWSFSAIASAETSVIRQGIPVYGETPLADSLDLSELQLLYFFYHPQTDALGNTLGDTTTALTTNFLDQGGHGIFTTLCLANWTGVVDEELAPYSTASTSLVLDSALARDEDLAHMQNAYWVPLTDTVRVKQMVRSYGSVSFSYYHAEANMNYETAAYYNSSETSLNHAVNIVGWDDNYSRENFKKTPSQDGAWLVKNNWGTSWGDQGYFWMSYDEKSLTGSNAFGYVYDFTSPQEYDHIYQYDGTSGFTTDRIDSGSSLANVFTVSGSGYERIAAVSLALYSTNVDYSIQIYKNPVLDPTDGIPMLDEAQTGRTACAGYMTIPLDQEDVILKEGDRFSVVITLSTESGSKVRYLLDRTYTNQSWISFENATQPGQSYCLVGDEWEDLGYDDDSQEVLGTKGETVRIKAFTMDAEAVPVEEVHLNAKDVSLTVGKSKSLKAEILPQNTTETTDIVWESSDPSVASVADGKVTALKVGSAKITARVGSCKAVCKVNVGLAAPTVKTVKAVGYRRIQITWSKVKGAGQYRVYRKTGKTDWAKVATIKSGSTVNCTDLVASDTTKYSYTVRAYAANGKTKCLSDAGTGLSAKAVPEKPTLKNPVSITTGIRTYWKCVTSDGYFVYRKTDKGSWVKLAQVKGGSKSSYLDKKVSRKHTYTYTVRAYFTNGKSYVKSGYDHVGKTIKR